MTASLILTESQILTVLRSFLLDILPSGIEVIRGQDNRVPEPAGPNFVEITPMFRSRLSTNVITDDDTAGVGSISDSTMTVTSMIAGAFAIGQGVRGDTVASGTTITDLGTATGGTGTYVVSPTQTVVTTTLQAGTLQEEQSTEMMVQIDVHGPSSGDNSQIISTLIRSEYAVTQMALPGYDMTTLYAEDPRQMPFLNGEQQIEDRWSVDVVLQVNPVVTVPQDFADDVVIDIISVEGTYPIQ